MFELRPVTIADGPAIQLLLSDPAVARWLRRAGQSGPFTTTECEAIVIAGAAHWTAHGFGRSLAWEDRRCIGWSLLGYTIATGDSEVEIGWTVAYDRWGRGIGTRLGERALRAARVLGLRSVVAFTRRDNLASRRVMDKLALEFEREFDYAGFPHVLYRAHLGGS